MKHNHLLPSPQMNSLQFRGRLSYLMDRRLRPMESVIFKKVMQYESLARYIQERGVPTRAPEIGKPDEPFEKYLQNLSQEINAA